MLEGAPTPRQRGKRTRSRGHVNLWQPASKAGRQAVSLGVARGTFYALGALGLLAGAASLRRLF